MKLLILGATVMRFNQILFRRLGQSRGRSPGSTARALAAANVAAAVLVLAACSGGPAASGTDASRTDEVGKRPVVVVATLPVLADLARNVGGELVEVRAVVPPGVDAHSYQTEPGDSVIISQADLTISNGAGMDDALIPVLEGARPADAIHVVASDGLDGGSSGVSEGDPHFWQNPLQAIHYVEQIRDGLIQVDSSNAARYREQAQQYTARLEMLDEEIAGLLDQVPPRCRIMITHHQAFSHLARQYGWQTLALAPGDAGSVTPDAIIQASQKISDTGVPSVFVEATFSSSALDQVARDAGINVSPLYAGLGGEARTYVEMMQFNARSLVDNLR